MNDMARIEPGADGDQVCLERTFAHPQHRIWAALTEPDQLAVWLMAADVFDLRVGGGIRFDEAGIAIAGEILVLEPQSVFEFTWPSHEPPPSIVRFELTAVDDGTRLKLTHYRNPSSEAAIEHAAGWHTHLELLDAMFTDRQPPEFWTRFHKLHAQYAAT